MIKVEVKKEPDETIKQREAAEAETALDQITTSQLDVQQIDVKPFLQPPSGITTNPLVFTNGHPTVKSINQNDVRPMEPEITIERNGVTHGVAVVGDYYDKGEEVLTDDRDLQVYEELMNQKSAEDYIKDPRTSRSIFAARFEKINCYLEDETNCQMITLRNDIINDGWSSFEYPRNFDDFLETIYYWGDNYLCRRYWPQEDIIAHLKAFPYSLKYNSFRKYSKASLAYLLILFYERLKKDADYLIKYVDRKDALPKGISAKVDKITVDDQWSEITLELKNDAESLKFGFCFALDLADSYFAGDNFYFGTILGKQSVKKNGTSVTYLTVKMLEFTPEIGDEMSIVSLFRIHHIFTAAECLFEMKFSEYIEHYISPDLTSGPSGVTLRFEDESMDLTPFDCDAVHKGVDTFSLSTAEASPVCCLDFRETSKSLKDLTDIVVQILISMRSVPIETRWIGLDIPALVICNNEEILSVLHEKFKKENFPIYRLSRKGVPTNLREKIPRIGKALAKALSNAKYLEDAKDYEELADKWEFADEGIFQSETQENKFNELIELAKVFAIRNSAVVLGNIYDLCNDIILNSSYCEFPVCIILGASSIPEVFTLPLMKYGCEKFVLIDRECSPWPGNKSMFTRLMSIYESDPFLIKGAKCSVVTTVKKKIKLPDPPKLSRHKLIEINTKDSPVSSSTSGGYYPDQRKNPRIRLPYCPKPTATDPEPNNDNKNSSQTS